LRAKSAGKKAVEKPLRGKPGYGCGRVWDRGGAIKGNHLYAWFSTEK
jgi:3D (Asp-Asp-Asp) domain-containing protein